MNPFEYLNAINTSKKNIMVDDIAEKDYNAFMVNRGLSYFADTVLLANEMNLNHHLDSRLQFDFFINIIENLEVIKEYYGYSDEKAKSVLSLFNDEDINELKNRIYKGGKRK